MDVANSEESPGGFWLYQAGMLDAAVGNPQKAADEFREALLQPDQSMLHHLARLAMSGH